ncbi:MAG: RIO1 family regulatory kinase/ATPase [Polyangiales bacterium]
MALPDSLVSLLEDGVIDTVERRLLSGKEASVYVVSRRGELLAAKVYKAVERRTFKATASYTEGRNQTRNSRDQRAMSKRSNYGRELAEESWRDMEFRALYNADAAGVRVPKPILLYGDVLLMELLVDEHGEPAPRLADTELDPHDAEPMFREVFRQVRLLLGTGKVHGDLSAFNILLTKAGPTIIDMPQVVDAPGNNLARDILTRDLQNVVGHLARFDARLLRFRHCGEALWRHYQMGSLDDATQPQEGSVRGERHAGGRREQLAERGRMGRADSEFRQNQRPPGSHSPSHHEPRREGVAVRQGHNPPRREGPPPPQSRRDGPPPQQRRDGPPPQSRRDGPPPQSRRDGPPPPRRAGPPPPRRDGPPPPRRDGPPPPRRDGPPPPQGHRNEAPRRKNSPDYPPVQIDLSRRDGRRPS